MSAISKTERVLVRMPSWLGDFVAAEPVVRSLYDQMHAAGVPQHLSLAAPPSLLRLFDSRFEAAQRIPVTKNSEGDGWRDHDVALLLNGAFRSAWHAFRSRIPRRVGSTKGGRAWLLTDRYRPARERGGIALGNGVRGSWPRVLPRPFDGVCLELAGLLGVDVRKKRPLLLPTEEARWNVRRRLSQLGFRAGQPVVLVNVGARKDSAKAFEADAWAEVADQVALRSGHPVFLLCGPGEEPRAEAVLRACQRPEVQALIEPVAQLPELVAWCAIAHTLLCTDGGVRHVGRATGLPTVVLFGPTDPRHTADHTGRERHVRVPVDCGPCHLELCPLAGSDRHKCMRSIPLRGVLDAALDRVEEGARVRAFR